MALYAFRNGVTMLDEVNLNTLLAAQSSCMIYDGVYLDGTAGSGVYEYNLATGSFIARFKANYGSTTVGRVELDLKKNGTGADVTLEIRGSDFIADGSNDGTLLKTVRYPSAIFTSGYISLPVDLSGLTPGGYYWIKLNIGGDATNHVKWMGEATQDVNYPAYYRVGTTGAWTAGNALHFKAYANNGGTYVLRHSIYGSNGMTLMEYNENTTIKHIWRWLPAADGSWQIVNKLTPIYDANLVTLRWEVQ